MEYTNYYREKNHSRKQRSIAAMLSVCIVFSMLMTFVQPVQALENQTLVLTCGKQEHTHDSSCYDETGALVCSAEEHTHGEGCYTLVSLMNETGDTGTESTPAPEGEPTAQPSATPAAVPTAQPTAAPTAQPTAAPTAQPSATPTAVPTAQPTAAPTAQPSATPTAAPTAEPTATPTAEPTAAPSPSAQPEIEITELNQPDPITAALGTKVEDLDLPKVLVGRYQDGQVELPVTWSCPEYLPDQPGEYIFTAQVETPAGFALPQELELPKLTVVLSAPNDALQPASETDKVVATGTAPDTTITYTIIEKQDEDGTVYHVLTLEGTGAMKDYQSSYSNYQKAPWYAYRSTLREVIVGEGITTIGSCSFYSNFTGPYSALTTVVLPGTLQSIGKEAFRECKKLSSVDFTRCPQLQSIGNYAFYRTSLTTVDLSACDSLQTIGNYAFWYCNSITGELKLPAGLQSIGEYAFSNCNKITGELKLPAGLQSIGQNAFNGCNKITGELKLPAGLQTISKGAFSRCSSLTSIDFSACTLLEIIEEEAFSSCNGLTGELKLPDTIKSIGASAFYNCVGLTGELVLPAALQSIGEAAFGWCTGLTSVNFSKSTSLQTMEAEAFFNCKGLAGELVLPAALQRIGNEAFYKAENLTVLDLSACHMLTDVDPGAFESCTSLKTVIVSLPEGGQAPSTALAAMPDGYKDLLIYNGNGTILFTADFLQVIKDKSWILSFEDRDKQVSFSLGEGVASVDSCAPLNTLSGPAYIDSQGAVCLLDTEAKTASLAFVPQGIANYTVPGTISSQGQEYSVTGVSPRALGRAYQLTAITFEAPGKVTLTDYALGACPTLRQVNDKTVVEEAAQLFAKPTSKYAFWGSGLIPGEDANRADPNTPIQLGGTEEGEPGAKAVLSVGAVEPCRTLDSAKNLWITGTGNTIRLNLSVDGANSHQYKYRFYMLPTDTGFDRTGLGMEEGVVYEDEKTGTQYSLHRDESIRDLFYVEVTRPENAGTTWSRQMDLQYAAGTAGGNLVVWVEMVGMDEAFSTDGRPAGYYYEFSWETEPMTYDNAAKGSGRTFSYTRVQVGAPIILDDDLGWTSDSEAAGRTYYKDYSSLALDQVQRVEHHFTITLPEGLVWSSELQQALKDGTVPLKVVGQELMANGATLLTFSLDANAPTLGGSVKLVDKNTLEVTVNQVPTVDGSADNFFNLMANTVTVEDEKTFDPQDKTKEITIDVFYRTIYTYHESQDTPTVQLTWNAEPPTGKVEIAKENNSTGYVVRVRNRKIFDAVIEKVVDDIPEQVYITPTGIGQLFTLSGMDFVMNEMTDNSDMAQYLTVTIKKARIYAYNNKPGEVALGEVTLSDGQTKYTLTAADTDEMGTPYTTQDVTITYVEGDNSKLTIRIGEQAPEQVAITDLEDYFIREGIVGTWETRYQVVWAFPEDYKILSGDTWVFQIPVEKRTTFQRLSDDNLSFFGALDIEPPESYVGEDTDFGNDAEVYEKGEPLKRSKTAWKTWMPECAIKKEMNADAATSGAAIDYTVTVYQRANIETPAGLPVVDVMSGVQVLLAPVEQNRNQPWVTEVDPPLYTDIDGTQYYKLELPKEMEDEGRYIYQGVWLGDYYADTVTVIAYDKLTEEEQNKYKHPNHSNLENAIVQDGMVTEIRWYLTSTTPASSTKGRELTYKSLPFVDYHRPGAAEPNQINNIVYLNDRDGDRLMYPTGIFPVRTFTGAKELTDASGNPLGVTTSVVTPGETVHYRLTVTNMTPQDRTLPGANFWDDLPEHKGCFEWTQANVGVRYAYADDPEKEVYFPWKLETPGATRPRITWPEGVRVPAKGTLYIYVDLTFPEKGEAWQNYCDIVKSGAIYNTFRINNEIYEISHTLAMPTEGYLQKGVRKVEYWANYGNTRDELMNHQVIFDKTWRYHTNVVYYVVIYNDGPGPLYLTELQDRLSPQDKNIAHYVGMSGLTSDLNLILEPEEFTGLPEGTTLMEADIKTRSDGVGTETFIIEPSQSPGNMYPDVPYDPVKEFCYLKPGQALAFSYRVNINASPDSLLNTIAMPLYDPYGSGASMAEDVSQIENNYYADGKVANDGSCDQWTSFQAEEEGFTSSYEADNWIYSQLLLNRGDIVPGLKKEVVQKRTGNHEPVSCSGYASPVDALQWKLTVSNNGDNAFNGFTITDTMPDYYTLTTGEVFLKEGKYKEQVLFTVTGVEQGSDKKVTAVTINNWKGVERTVTVGGAALDEEDSGFSLKLYYNQQDQMVMELEIQREYLRASNATDYATLLPNETAELTFWTENRTGIQNNTTFINTAVLTLPDQKVSYDKVSIGRVLWDDEGNGIGVQARAAVTISTGYSTASLKSVAEQGVPENTTSSLEGDAISLTSTQDGYSGFTYQLEVNNSADDSKGIQWLTLIDNLPEVGDHFTLNQDMERGSEFQVNFQNDPQVKVWYVTDAAPTDQHDLTQYATIQYSNKTQFESADWGTVVGGTFTQPQQEGWGAYSNSARAVRIFIKGDTEAEPIIPADAKVYVTFNCQVADPSAVKTGDIAWNTFGYRYQMKGDTFHLESAPLEVGVKIPDYPRLQKSLVDDMGQPAVADKAETFNFLIYTGDALTGEYATGRDLLNGLNTSGRKFTLVSLEFKEGDETNALKLQNLKEYSYSGTGDPAPTVTDWAWTPNENYTVVELGDLLSSDLGIYWDYQFYQAGNAKENSYTFTYEKGYSQLIHFKNQTTSRRLEITKVDQADNELRLAGALFGLYSKEQSEAFTEEQLAAKCTELSLTEEQKAKVEATKTVECGGETYYLCGLGLTSDSGQVAWGGLPGEYYCYLELWAPDGYLLTQEEPVPVAFKEGERYIYQVLQTVENTKDYRLPKTGGAGTIPFTAAGLGLTAGAAVLLLMQGRRCKKRKT